MSRFDVSVAEAWRLLERSPEITVATSIAGQPLVRTMHAAVVDETLVLHGTPEGEKVAWAGAPVAIAAEEVVARIPSHWRHPERACPATTWYRSVHLEGHVDVLDDIEVRARGLQRLMEQLQPEGGYRPLSATDPLYARTIAGLGVWRIVPTRISGRAKLGQHLNRAAMDRVLRGLWQRGAPGDLAAIEACRQAHPEPVTFAPMPEPYVARCHPLARDVDAAVALVRDAYWNLGFEEATLAGAVRNGAWVGIEARGELVASARAVTDRCKRGTLFDVIVRPDHRGRGLGKLLLRLLLDHPTVRDVAALQLVTRDATGFYAPFGFSPVLTRGAGDDARTVMVRDRRSV